MDYEKIYEESIYQDLKLVLFENFQFEFQSGNYKVGLIDLNCLKDIINTLNLILKYFKNTNYTIEQTKLYEGNTYMDNYYVYSQQGTERRICFYCCNKNIELVFSIANLERPQVERFRLHGKNAHTDEFEIFPDWVRDFYISLGATYNKIIDLKEKEPARKEALKEKVNDTLINLSKAYEELTIQEIVAKIGYKSLQKLEEIRKIIEDLLFEGKLNARIRSDSIVFGKHFEEKTVEILTDIKDDTELIKQYTAQLEEILDKTEDIEIYLKTHLASDYEKIKDKIDDYKRGKINRRELAKQILKSLGKTVGKVLIKKI